VRTYGVHALARYHRASTLQPFGGINHIDPLQVPNNKNPARVVPVYRRVGACRGTLWGDNKGHDKNRPDGDKTLKLDWSDDKAGALAIIEYLKTR
jgi:hypothetical protein